MTRLFSALVLMLLALVAGWLPADQLLDDGPLRYGGVFYSPHLKCYAVRSVQGWRQVAQEEGRILALVKTRLQVFDNATGALRWGVDEEQDRYRDGVEAEFLLDDGEHTVRINTFPESHCADGNWQAAEKALRGTVLVRFFTRGRQVAALTVDTLGLPLDRLHYSVSHFEFCEFGSQRWLGGSTWASRPGTPDVTLPFFSGTTMILPMYDGKLHVFDCAAGKQVKAEAMPPDLFLPKESPNATPSYLQGELNGKALGAYLRKLAGESQKPDPAAAK